MFPRSTQRLANAIFAIGVLAVLALVCCGVYSLWLWVR